MAESELQKITGIGPKAAKTLDDCGYNTIEKIAKASADELSQLPGIGKATAEKYIESAKEMVKAEKPAVKATVEITKESIPKPKTPKSAVIPATKPSEPMPSVKKPVEKPVVKAVVKKPAIKKPEAKAPVKKKPAKSLYVKTKVSKVAEEAIEAAPAMRNIKKKRGTKKTKAVKKEKISQTYGIVNSILHDRSGKSANRSVVMKLYNTEIPLPRYLGRKVIISMPNSEKQLTGTINSVHGKKTSDGHTVIVRFKHSVSPHIISARAQLV